MKELNKTLEEELKKLPLKPGVYIMKDIHDEILYIGKAVVLKNRVRQYFQASTNHTLRIKTMISKIDHFEYIVTNSELEALILECNLIKEHKPRFNVLLKDDKTYPYIKITTNEKFPRLFITRKVFRDGSKYFGPYTDVAAVREILAFLKKIFPLRTCDRDLSKELGRQRACLNFHIGQCLAPCQGKVSEEAYAKLILEVTDFLNGKYGALVEKMEKDMEVAAENLEYEKAVLLRDRIHAAHKLMEKQKITHSGESSSDMDVVGLARSAKEACVQIFFVRNGKLIGNERFMFKQMEDIGDSEILTSFLKQFYGWVKYIPQQILLEKEIEDMKVIEEWLSGNKNAKVEIKVPQKGDKKNLVDMAIKNAEIQLERYGVGYEKALLQLSDILGNSKNIKKIEAFDISNLSGTSVVGSMVVFEGKLDKRQYKRYKIKTVQGQNDVECMREVVTRRLKRAEGDKMDVEKFGRAPDLILLDGGKQQVNAVKEIIRESGHDILLAGMIKDKKHKTRGLILVDGTEIELTAYPEAFKLIFEIQEEVHRYAIDYHRKLRKKETIRSGLDEIPGIGEVRKKELLKHFSSLETIKKASVEELSKVKTMNIKIASRVYDFYHR